MMRVLHFTDLHARMALPGHNGHMNRLSREIPRLLRQMAAAVEAEKPDFVALTGDILDAPHALLDGKAGDKVGLLESMAVKDYEYVRDWLEQLGRPWMALPGNHDHAPSFARVFGRYAKERELDGVRILAFHDWEQEHNKARRIGDELLRFSEAMEAAKPDSVDIHLQHYLIRPFVDYGYPLLYGDADELAEVLTSQPGRRLVLSGHWHEGTPVTQNGDVSFSVCPAFCEPPHHYRVYEFGAEVALATRHETLRRDTDAAVPVIVVDRTDLLSPPATAGEPLGLSEDAGRLIEALGGICATIVASCWDDPDTAHANWREIQYLHDDFFDRLRQTGSQGSGLVIYLSDFDASVRKLPAERVTRLDDLVERVCDVFGSAPSRVLLVTADQMRADAAKAQGAFSLLVSDISDVGGLVESAASFVAGMGFEHPLEVKHG